MINKKIGSYVLINDMIKIDNITYIDNVVPRNIKSDVYCSFKSRSDFKLKRASLYNSEEEEIMKKIFNEDFKINVGDILEIKFSSDINY